MFHHFVFLQEKQIHVAFFYDNFCENYFHFLINPKKLLKTLKRQSSQEETFLFLIFFAIEGGLNRHRSKSANNK